MARSSIVFHPEAAHEVEDARNWYKERSSTAADDFLAELNHAVVQVTSAPHRWPRYKAGTRRYVFRRFPYSLIYKVYENEVRALAVAHDRRRQNYWVARSRKATVTPLASVADPPESSFPPVSGPDLG